MVNGHNRSCDMVGNGCGFDVRFWYALEVPFRISPARSQPCRTRSVRGMPGWRPGMYRLGRITLPGVALDDTGSTATLTSHRLKEARKLC